MLRLPAPLPPPAPDLDVQVVEDAETLAEFEQVLTDGFDLAAVGRPAVADEALLSSVLHLVVGRVAGRAVACAGAAVRHGIVEIDWVATRPEARRHGYGRAVTAAAPGVAPDLPAMLISADEGHAIYRRLGFLDLFRASMWEHPAQQ